MEAQTLAGRIGKKAPPAAWTKRHIQALKHATAVGSSVADLRGRSRGEGSGEGRKKQQSLQEERQAKLQEMARAFTAHGLVLQQSRLYIQPGDATCGTTLPLAVMMGAGEEEYEHESDENQLLLATRPEQEAECRQSSGGGVDLGPQQHTRPAAYPSRKDTLRRRVSGKISATLARVGAGLRGNDTSYQRHEGATRLAAAAGA